MKNHKFLKSILMIIGLLILIAGASIPFLYESPSIFYKTGFDNIMLRAGKVLGIVATILILYQLILISGFKKIESIIKVPKLFQFHRINGLIILGTVILHPVLILGADHFVFFPIEYKYWPELTGVGLFILLFLFIVVSYWRHKFKLDYGIWKILHKSFAPIIIIIIFIHVFNVSRSFEEGPPLYGLIVFLVLSVLLIGRKYFKKP